MNGGVRVKELEKNITKIYYFDFFISFIFVGPIIVLFIESRGISFKDIMILQSIFAIAIFALEVPTGIIGDRLGRKKTITIASFILVVSHICYVLSDSFIEFLFAEILFAFAFAMFSGTIEAFIYDTLLELNKEDEFKKILGKKNFIGYISSGLGAIMGGLLAKISLDFVFYANTLTLIVAPFIALSLTEPNYKKSTQKRAYKEIIDISKKIFFNGSNLKWIVVFSAIVYAFNQSVFWTYQPYLKLCGVDLVYFGIIFASFQVVAAYSSKYAHNIEAKIGTFGSLILIVVMVGVSEILMGSFIYLFSFILIYAQQFARGFKAVIISDIINKEANSTYRATILSLVGFVSKLFVSIVMLIVGYIQDLYSIRVVLVLLGVLVLVFGFSIILIIRSKNVVSKQDRKAK
jgi:MFS family permease